MRHSAVLSVLAVALFTAGCETPSETRYDEVPVFSRSVQADVGQEQLLRSVRQATARFNSTQAAIQAGYVPSNHCASHPELGGMGYHWVNPGLMDGHFDPAQPEALLYARGHDGHLRLVGVEYIVMAQPEQDLEGEARPHFGTQPLDIGGTPTPGPHWSLHVWLYEANPAGMFAPFNPGITCGH
jgi:hypothetical protein